MSVEDRKPSKKRKFGIPHIFGAALIVAFIAYGYFYYKAEAAPMDFHAVSERITN